MLLTGGMPDRGRLEDELCTVTAPRARLEPIGSFGGVSYIDDALASNPDGTIAALRVFDGRRVALIVGGFDRGLDYEPLARAIESTTPRPVVLWTGPAGKAIAAALERMSGTAARRWRRSRLLSPWPPAWPGIEVVLFSPASPTPHDEGTYFDRGRALPAGCRRSSRRR